MTRSCRIALAAAALTTAIGGCSASATLKPPRPPAAPRTDADAPGGPAAVEVTHPPAAWTDAIAAGAIPRRPGEHLTIDAVGPAGHLVVADSRAGTGPDTVMLIQVPSWHRTPIQTLPPGATVLGAAFDGRDLVYTVAVPGHPDRWALRLWDAASGQAPRQIARNGTDATGLAIPGPINRPILDHGRVIWVQGDPDGTTNIRMYTIATRTTKLIRRGHPGAPFVMGRMLLWPELRKPGALTTLSAYSLDMLQSVALPGGLAAVSGPTSIAASADAVAWVDATAVDLWIWRASGSVPRLAVRAGGGARLSAVHVSGPIVAFNSAGATWALDMRSMRYTRVATIGDSGAWGPALAFGPADIVDTRTLPPLP